MPFTRVQLEFNSHLTGNPRSTEITNDYSPSITSGRPLSTEVHCSSDDRSERSTHRFIIVTENLVIFSYLSLCI